MSVWDVCLYFWVCVSVRCAQAVCACICVCAGAHVFVCGCVHPGWVVCMLLGVCEHVSAYVLVVAWG